MILPLFGPFGPLRGDDPKTASVGGSKSHPIALSFEIFLFGDKMK